MVLSFSFVLSGYSRLLWLSLKCVLREPILRVLGFPSMCVQTPHSTIWIGFFSVGFIFFLPFFSSISLFSWSNVSPFMFVSSMASSILSASLSLCLNFIRVFVISTSWIVPSGFFSSFRIVLLCLYRTLLFKCCSEGVCMYLFPILREVRVRISDRYSNFGLNVFFKLF